MNPTLGRSSDIDRPRPSAPELLQVGFVLGDGNVIPYRLQLGEVLQLPAPEQLLEALRAGHWQALEVTRLS